MALFKLKNITCRKKSRASNEVITVFDKASLTINGDGIFVITGPSGAGKSTLLRFLNRLEDPDEGEILFKEQPLTVNGVFELRRKIGMLFQLPTLPEKTVRENILFGPELSQKKIPETELKKIMEQVDLDPDLLQREAMHLSVGQQQRVSLARALINRPEVLLLDEPTSSLDSQSSAKIEETIKKLVQNDSLQAVWVTHDQAQAERLSPHGARIENRGFSI